MKKLNNKGFAISTLLYGLLLVVFLVITLLMSVMATNRKNTKDLVEKIEADLNRYEKTSTTLFAQDDGSIQSFTVPEGQDGWYKIEIWGARGDIENAALENTSVGKGAYAATLVELNAGTKLYIYLGTTDSSHASYNSAEVRFDSSGLSSYGNEVLLVAAGGERRTGPANGYPSAPPAYNDGGSYKPNSGSFNVNGTQKNLDIKNQIIISGVSSEEKAIAKIQKVSDPSGVKKIVSSPTVPTANYYIGLNSLDNESFITNNTSATPSEIKYKLFNGSTAQKWLIEAVDSSTYKIVSLKDLKALKSDGSILTTDDYDGSEAFKWEIEQISGPLYSIKKTGATQYLGVSGTDKSGELALYSSLSEDTKITFINADY